MTLYGGFPQKGIDDDKYCEGYIHALLDFGIWKSGQQVIGCLETPIQEIIKKIEEPRSASMRTKDDPNTDQNLSQRTKHGRHDNR